MNMDQLLKILQSTDTVTFSLEGCGSSSYPTREVYEAIRPFVDKQIPKRFETIRTHRWTMLKCPVCNGNQDWPNDYCKYCGQALDWSK